MTTITRTQDIPLAAARRAGAAIEVSAPSRREFLYYIWGASIVLLLGQATAGLIWFALPRFKEGAFGGVFNFAPDRFPTTAGNAPVSQPEGRFHVIHTENDGLLTLYAVCTHLGCLPPWRNIEFACPCHGSRYTLDGDWLGGPAPRGLDIFRTRVTFEDGTLEETVNANSLDGKAYAIPLQDRAIARIEIDTGDRMKRPNHS